MPVVKQLPDSKTHEDFMPYPTYQQVLVNRETGEMYAWTRKLANDKTNPWDTVINPEAVIKNGKLMNKEHCQQNHDYLEEITKKDWTKKKTDESVALRLKAAEYRKILRSYGIDPDTGEQINANAVDSSNEADVKARNEALAKSMMPDEVVAKVTGLESKGSAKKEKLSPVDPFAEKLEEVEELDTREGIDSFVSSNFDFTTVGSRISDMKIVKALKLFYNYEISVAELERKIGAERPFVENYNETQSIIDESHAQKEDTVLGAEKNGAIDVKSISKMQKPQIVELMREHYNVDVEDAKGNFMQMRKAVKHLVNGDTNIKNFLSVVPGSKIIEV